MNFSIKYLLLAITFFVFTSQVTIAQSGAIKRADKLTSNFDFVKASEILKRIVNKDPANGPAKEKLANCYRILNNTAEAEFWYAQLKAMPNAKPEVILQYAQLLKANKKYELANEMYDTYYRFVPSDVRGEDNTKNAKKMTDLLADNPSFTVTPVSVNTENYDFSPVFFKDGILFVSNSNRSSSVSRKDVWTQNKFFDIYYSKKSSDGALEKPQVLKGNEPNRKYHEASASASADSKEIFFTRNLYVKSKVRKSKDKKVKLGIFKANYNDEKNEWVDLTELPFNNAEYSIAHPSISQDGKRLYFISDMPGGEGETDVYVSYKEGANWGAPINLGKGVNTPGKEMFPYIAEDGTLFFASDGWMGLGGLDVFYSSYSNGKWAKAGNIGAPINTNKDDFGLIFEKGMKSGYLSSNREGGKGSDDIYYFTYNASSCLNVVVLDEKTKMPIKGADVEVVGLRKFKSEDKGETKACPTTSGNSYSVSASKSGYKKATQEVTAPGFGDATVTLLLKKADNIDLVVNVKNEKGQAVSGAIILLKDLKTGKSFPCTAGQEGSCTYGLQPNANYEVMVSAKSDVAECIYSKEIFEVSTVGKTAPLSIVKEVTIKKLCENQVIEIPDIYYDLNKFNIRPDAAIQLNRVVELLSDNPGMTIELRSHTDCRSDDSYNMKLSQNRAEAAVAYISSRGINRNRMTAKGYGESMPKINCSPCKEGCTEVEHQMNRRTEFKIIKIN